MNIIVVSAHPDDEVLGCGGTLLIHKYKNDKIFWIISTKIYENQGYSLNKIKERESEIDNVRIFLGIEKVFNLNYPTTRLDSTSIIEMIPQITTIFKEVEPEVIYVMNRSDAHSDHRITFDAIMACSKSFRHPYIKKILMYECLSETEFSPTLPENIFQPNYYVDITSTFREKISCMSIYNSEIEEHPFPRSFKNIEALATFRGASVGVFYAESFQLIKLIEK